MEFSLSLPDPVAAWVFLSASLLQKNVPVQCTNQVKKGIAGHIVVKGFPATVLGLHSASDQIMSIKLCGKIFNRTIVSVHAPTTKAEKDYLFI